MRAEGARVPSRSSGEIALEDRRLFALLAGLSTEARNSKTLDIDTLDTESVLRRLHAEDRTVLDVVEAAIPSLAIVVDHVVAAFRAGGRLFYAGAGTSGRLGVLDAAECPPTFGTNADLVQGLIAGGTDTLVRSAEGVEDESEQGKNDVDAQDLGPDDVLVGISASRRTPYVRGALQRARERGAWTAFVVGNALDPEGDTPADQVIEVVTGPEAITGSTRMKAALAQKMLLTMLTTTAMVRWGKTFENLMVDVAPTSRKLVERSKGLVMQLGDVDYDRATELLALTSSQVKPAVLMARTGESLDVADEWLDRAQGNLRDAMVLAGLDPELIGDEARRRVREQGEESE